MVRRVVRMRGDGNCLFRALSQCDGENHQAVREKVVRHLRTHWDSVYQSFVSDEEKRDDYLTTLSRPGVWGDELCLAAYSAVYRCPVRVYAATAPHALLAHYGATRRGGAVRRVLYNGCHYDSLVAKDAK